ncbi:MULTISPECIES: lipopolysaccharide biosynthesis protein [Pseudofrankia]|uniref:lipopolysaccharide biosynthesis protein n=1 Tax=Pseudofrankia TaxID=2994363 RepID=UPI000234BF16|nr:MULTISPECIES: lipopolysaccharide biosynthesis protein [Pseudofrankia]OHV37865.1 hypothetical protein BCD49_15430 [Pseudofrankia sp. EUN1h]
MSSGASDETVWLRSLPRSEPLILGAADATMWLRWQPPTRPAATATAPADGPRAGRAGAEPDSSVLLEPLREVGAGAGPRGVPEPRPAAEASSSSDDAVAREVSGMFGRDSLYMLLWAVQIVGAAGVTPFVTRLMGADEFGAVAAANAVMQVLFQVAGLGLQTAIQWKYADSAAGSSDGPAEARRLLTLCILAATAITWLVDTTGRWWAPSLGFEHYGGALRLAVFWAGIAAVTNAQLALLRSQDRLLGFGLVSMLQSVVAEMASLALVAVTTPTATSFIRGQLVSQIAATALAVFLVVPGRLGPRDRRLVGASLAYALPLVPAVLATLVLNAGNRFIVQSHLGPAAVARYQIAYNIGSLPTLLLSVLNSAWMPRIFAVSDPATRAAVLAASRDALYRLLSPVLVGLALAAPLLLRTWAPAGYGPGQLLAITSIVIVCAVPATASLAPTRALMAAGATVSIAVGTAIAAAGNIALSLVLVPRLGLSGGALATGASYCLLHGFLLARARVAAPTARTSPLILVELGLVVAAVLGLSLVPADGPVAFAGRAVAMLAALAWFGVIFRMIARGKGAARPAGRRRASGPRRHEALEAAPRARHRADSHSRPVPTAGPAGLRADLPEQPSRRYEEAPTMQLSWRSLGGWR